MEILETPLPERERDEEESVRCPWSVVSCLWLSERVLKMASDKLPQTKKQNVN